jgi:molybdenum cofactor cytidylyltransferase
VRGKGVEDKGRGTRVLDDANADDSPQMIAAVVLAAGASRRFGGHKLLAPVHGWPLVRLVVEQVLASGVERVFVVLGRDAGAVRRALDGLPVEFVANPDYADGMSTSLRCGIEALPPDASAVVIALGDQPLPSPSIIDGLIEAFRASGRPVVVPVYAGERGNPVLFGAPLFAELLEITGDRGARAVIARHPERVEAVPFPFAPPLDVDTPADFERLLLREPPATG